MSLQPPIKPLIAPLVIPPNDNYFFGIPLIQQNNIYRAAFSRASIAAFIRSTDGVLTEVGNNTPRFDSSLGMLVEGQRANIFLNSATPVTQSVSVTAVAHTLSFYGTGSIVLSGAASGTLTGTGAGLRTTLTFTPSAGTLTLTLSGAVSFPQLEIGSFATQYTPSSSTAVTRLADQTTWPLNTLGIASNGACTVVGRFIIPQAAITGSPQILIQVDDGSDNNRFFIRNIPGGLTLGGAAVLAGSGTDSAASTISVNVSFGMALTINSGTLSFSINGDTVRTASNGPTSGLTTMRAGIAASGLGNLNGYVRRLRYTPVATPVTNLPSLSLAA